MSHSGHHPSAQLHDRHFGRRNHRPGDDLGHGAPLRGQVALILPVGRKTHALHVNRNVAYGLFALVGLSLLWSLVSASYLVFKDEVLRRVVHEQHEVAAGYEERISELRSQLDRMTSRQLVDQDSVERKLDVLARRQVILETRQSVVTSLSEAVGMAPAKAPVSPNVLPTDASGFAPLRTGDPELRPSQKQSSLVPPFGGKALNMDEIRTKARANIHAALERLESSVSAVEGEQGISLDRISKRADERLRVVRAAFSDLGLPVPKNTMGVAQPLMATGGPLVPLSSFTPDTPAFDAGAYRIQAAAQLTEQLKAALSRVPLRRPVDGDPDLTSGFGARIDPFLRTWAMHTGLDFRADSGDLVHATASGTVTTAEYSGGYGNMVEIDHGNGLSTRYGHLSKIDVYEGQNIRAGQVVGRAGSTGRSTGPHVHYETRVNGDAVDPLRFLRAATKVARAME